jgi:hypothetical protein
MLTFRAEGAVLGEHEMAYTASTQARLRQLHPVESDVDRTALSFRPICRARRIALGARPD